MPSRAPRVCGLCGKAHLTGEQCALIAARERARKARHDANRPSAAKRGYDNSWRTLRAKHLVAHPYCVRCGARAIVADHIIPVRIAPHRRLDPTNLQSLCTHHHSGAKQSEERRRSPSKG